MANRIIKYARNSNALSSQHVFADVGMTASSFASYSNSQGSQYEVGKNFDADAVKESIKNIFTWIPGERIINPEFGSNLRSYLYEGITDYNQEKIMAEIHHCFSTWEPRARLERVNRLTDVEDKE